MSSKQPVSGVEKPEKLVIAVSAAIGLCILGDSLMYGILPLAADSLGIPLALVGVLLSANRLVRLVSNTWLSALFERFGPRRPFVAATVLGVLTTVLYGLGWGFAVFLLARLGWGVAWSGLRQGGYQAVWTGSDGRTGRLMGIMWGIIRLGSAISVLVGGYLWDNFGYHSAVGVIAGMSTLAIPVALLIAWPGAAASPVPQQRSAAKDRTRSLEGWRLALSDPRQRWMLLIGFLKLVFSSVVISTAALFLADRLGTEQPLAALGIGIGTVAGMVLALRWLSDLAIGPSLGALSDRVGQSRMAALLVVTVFMGIIGAVSFSGLLSLACLSLVLILNTGVNVTLDAAANRIARETARPHLYVGAYTTASDAGSAVGPLLAYSLAGAAGFSTMYLLAAAVLTLVVLRYWWRAPSWVAIGRSQRHVAEAE